MNVRRSAQAIALALAAGFSAIAPCLADEETSPPQHDYYGNVRGVRGPYVYVQLRTKRMLVVDDREAAAAHRVLPLTPGRPVHVRGNPGPNGVVRAFAIVKSHSDARFWPPDK